MGGDKSGVRSHRPVPSASNTLDPHRSEEIEESSNVEQIASLTAKVAALERQLKSAPPGSSNHLHNTLARLPTQTLLQDPALPGTPTPRNDFVTDKALASVSSTVQRIWGTSMSLSPAEHDTLRDCLLGHAVTNAQIGRASTAWQLGQKGLMTALTRHLLDGPSFLLSCLRTKLTDQHAAACAACCSKLPGIAPLAARIDRYKRDIDNLTPQEQCHVTVLCALGARASPHSQILGVDTAKLRAGGPSIPLYLHAGQRREMACRQLEARARELCWRHGLVSESSLDNLNALTGLVQLFICATPFLHLPPFSFGFRYRACAFEA
jgi:hypothetical protein